MQEKQQFLDLRGLTEVLGYIKEYMSSTNNPICPYASYTLFPSVGDQESIYIDTSTNAIYRWDDANVKYYPLAFDPTVDFIMQGGNAKGW